MGVDGSSPHRQPKSTETEDERSRPLTWRFLPERYVRLASRLRLDDTLGFYVYDHSSRPAAS